MIEGQNILEARSIIYNANAVSEPSPGMGQRPGDDKTNMSKSAQGDRRKSL